MIVLGNFTQPSLVPDLHGRCCRDVTVKHPKTHILSSSFHTWGRKTPELAHMAFISMLLIYSQNQAGVQILGCTQTMPIHL